MERASGKLRNFIIEPFLPHKDDEEAYVCIYSHRYADTILFHHQGGVDIGDVDAKALRLDVPIDATVSAAEIEAKLLKEVTPGKKKLVSYIPYHLVCFNDLSTERIILLQIEAIRKQNYYLWVTLGLPPAEVRWEKGVILPLHIALWVNF